MHLQLLSRSCRCLPLAALFHVIAAASTLGATAPYSDNFDSYATGSPASGFVTSISGLNSSGSWGVGNNGSNGVYASSLSTNQGGTSSTISITNVAGTDFVFSTNFTLSAPFTFSQIYSSAVGITALSGYSVSYETFGTGAFPPPGSLSLSGIEASLPGSGFFLPPAAGTTYTMTLAGVYTPTGLMLTATLTDGTNILVRSGFDTTPATGSSFGYFHSASATVQRAISTSVQFDDFSVSTVPEPSTLACLFVSAAGVALGVWRQRRRG